MRSPLSVRSLFMRPSNMMMTHLLQTLSIANFLAKKSGDKLIRFRIPREPDQQRILNFASFTFENSEIANQLINQSLSLKAPLNSRAACNYETLFIDREGENRDIGLIEVASLVGLPISEVGKQNLKDGNASNSFSDQNFVLAPISEKVEKIAFEAEMKLERRQNLDDNYQPIHQRPNNNKNGAYTFAEKANHIPPEHNFSMLQSSLKRFGGFAGKISGAITT